jgi:uncharacterized protein (DUF433 family)
MTVPDFLCTTADGEVLLRGHRIGLFHVVRLYNEGHSPEMLVCQYPTLSLALVHKVIAFYLEHQEEVDRYVDRCRAELYEAREAEKRLDLGALRARLKSLHQVEVAAGT